MLYGIPTNGKGRPKSIRLSEDEIAGYRRLRDDFEFYAERCLKIRTNSGEITPFILNASQRYLHRKLEEQIQKTGKVRAMVLKARQEGISTYIEGRFIHKTTFKTGIRTQIQTHQDQATQNIFEIANRFYENLPETVKPTATASSAKELTFGLLDSRYTVSTAGTKGVGRSATIQLLHNSEFAFWPNASEHLAGILQTVPESAGTEIIFETTANGVGGTAYDFWKSALEGKSEFQAIFIPWFWMQEYRRAVPDDFSMSEEDEEYARIYGLDNRQMAWRAVKIAELGSGWRFKQEYPATAEEAFQSSSLNPLIPVELVQRAMRATLDSVGNPRGMKVMGVDVARYGDDDSVITVRKGRVIYNQIKYSKIGLMDLAGRVALHAKGCGAQVIIVDDGGLGGGVTDRLIELGFVVVAVNFGSTATDEEHYANRRAEMYGVFKNWLLDEPCILPEDGVLASEIASIQYGFDSKGRVLLEKKSDIKKRLGRSPDRADSLALTFAEYFPVPAEDEYDEFLSGRQRKTGRSKVGGY